MTAVLEQAAQMLAEGRMSMVQIARDTGIGLRSLVRYKTEDKEFREAVERYQKLLRSAIEQQGLALVTERIRHKMERHAMLRKIVAGRAKDEAIRAYLHVEKDKPAPWCGCMVVRWKGKDADQPEFAVDTGILSALDQLERDIATELGQWKQKVDHSGSVMLDVPPEVKALARAFLPEELQDMKRRMEQAMQSLRPENTDEPEPDCGTEA